MVKSNKEKYRDYFNSNLKPFLTKEKANKHLLQVKNNLEKVILEKAVVENYTKHQILDNILMANYCYMLTSIEARNSISPYEYMDFSRRTGEFWGLFCETCFKYSVNNLTLYDPPVFCDEQNKKRDIFLKYIDSLGIKKKKKLKIKKQYNATWSMLASISVNLKSDFHFIYNDERYIIDFKSGFGSNEKGNTDRLLLVGSAYKSLSKNHRYRCILIVRDGNSAGYLNLLENSGLWEVYSDKEAYDMMTDYTGYDVCKWVVDNVFWEIDLNVDTVEHLKKNDLMHYLDWKK